MIIDDEIIQLEIKASNAADNNQTTTPAATIVQSLLLTSSPTEQCVKTDIFDIDVNMNQAAIPLPPSTSTMSPSLSTSPPAVQRMKNDVFDNDVNLNQAAIPPSTMSPSTSTISPSPSPAAQRMENNVLKSVVILNQIIIPPSSPPPINMTNNLFENFVNLNQTTPTTNVISTPQQTINRILKESSAPQIQSNVIGDNPVRRNLFKFEFSLTESLKILYKDEYEVELRSYMSDVLNISAAAASADNLLLDVWSVLFVHMTVEMLSRICKVHRLRSDELVFENLLKNSVKSKFILIEELFNENYNIERNELLGIQRLAINPGSYFPIESRYKSTIMCHIYANVDCNEINIDFYNSSDINEFNMFFFALRTNIESIIAAYFKKIHFFHLYDECKEHTFMNTLITNQFDIGVVKDPCEIELYQESVRYLMNENQLRILEIFIQKFYPEIDLIDNPVKVCELWVEFTSGFIIDILTKVFAIELKKNYHELKFSDKEISFDITCSHDIITNRSQYNGGLHSRYGRLSKEVRQTVVALRSGLPFERQLRAILHIKSDVTNRLITITFYNLLGPTSHPMNIFLKQFKSTFKKLLENYYEKLLGGYLVFTGDPHYM